jgi:ribonuclease P protein component
MVEVSATRIGVVAGKSVGGAVVRNRAKRLLREAVRAYGAQLTPGWDVMLIARAPLAKVKLPETQAALGGLLKRAGLLVK